MATELGDRQRTSWFEALTVPLGDDGRRTAAWTPVACCLAPGFSGRPPPRIADVTNQPATRGPGAAIRLSLVPVSRAQTGVERPIRRRKNPRQRLRIVHMFDTMSAWSPSTSPQHSTNCSTSTPPPCPTTNCTTPSSTSPAKPTGCAPPGANSSTPGTPASCGPTTARKPPAPASHANPGCAKPPPTTSSTKPAP